MRPPPRAAAPLLPLLAASLVLGACSDDGGTPITPPPGGDDDVPLDVETVVDGLVGPTYLTAPEGDERLFVLEQPGRVRVVRDGQLLQAPYMDISGMVETGGGEQGLLGMAFHPDFADNGRFYLNFTVTGGDTRVVRYTVADPAADRADVTSTETLLSVAQPFPNHNGGMLAFGPDGMLYVALGDGGSGGDPDGNGQDSTTVLGSILRLTPDGEVPQDGLNPFVDGPGDDRIWAYGLRNPWRFAFDPSTGTLFVADVGQNDWEEVNAVQTGQAGVNYGWDVMEGAHCFEPDEGCDQDGLTLPVVEYGHDEGNSITGGFVYRGPSIPEATGRYFFADFGSAFVRSFRLEGGEAVDLVEHDLGGLSSITSFGTDAQGELYILEGGGRVLRLVPE